MSKRHQSKKNFRNGFASGRSPHRKDSKPMPAVEQPKIGTVISQHLSHGRRHRVLVLTRREAAMGWQPTYSSQFNPTRARNDSRKGSDFIAKMRVHGRPVFLDRDSPRPADLSRVYGFELVGENRDATVYFASIVMPEHFEKPTSISIDVRTGKMVANNARMPKLPAFKTRKPIAPVAVNYGSDRDDDFDDLFGSYSDFYADEPYDTRFACAGDCDEDSCTCVEDDGDVGSFIAAEIAEMNTIRPMNATWCTNCGCRICECDGTPMVDGQPYLMPRHLTEVRFPTRDRSRTSTQRRRNYWA